MKELKWHLIVVAALGTQVYLLLADVVFVTYYSLLSNPGHDTAYYQAFAQETAGAFVFCFAPVSIYLISRWLCRKAGAQVYLHAVLFIVGYYVLDYAIIALVAFDQMAETLRVAFLLNTVVILSSALVGAWSVQKKSA